MMDSEPANKARRQLLAAALSASAAGSAAAATQSPGNTPASLAQPQQALLALSQSTGSTNIGNGGETIAQSFEALQLPDYAALKAYTGPRKSVYVTGYLGNEAPSSIAGMFIPDPSDKTSATNHGTIFVAVNGMRWKRQYSGPVDVRWWGARFDNVHDDAPAIQACIDYAQPLQKQIFLPEGTAILRSGLKVKLSLLGLTMTGQGFQRTRLDYQQMIPPSGAALTIVGHSGQLCGAVIEGIGFDGNSASSAIVLAGQDGQKIRNCQFGLNRFGGIFRNGAAGSFTEYCVFENCDFLPACASAAWYNVVGKGDVSFHGSGLRGCTISMPDKAGSRAIVIDPTAHPYNSPLDVQVWATASGTLLDMEKYRGGRPYFIGTLTLEVFSGVTTICNAPSGMELALVGKIACSSSGVRFGSIFTCDSVVNNVAGSRQTTGAKVAVQKSLTAGNVQVEGISPHLQGGCNLWAIRVTAPNYEHRSLQCSFSHFGGGQIAQMALMHYFDSHGWGPPVFSLGRDGVLVISNTNYPAKSVTATVEVTQLGQSLFDPFTH